MFCVIINTPFASSYTVSIFSFTAVSFPFIMFDVSFNCNIISYSKNRISICRKFNKFSSANISVMVLLIISAAITFSQLLAFTGATYGMIDAVMSIDISNKAIVFSMIMLVILMGMFMGPLPIMLITLPIFIPIVIQFGFDPIWFAAMYLVAIETGATSPPFGAALFVMKGVAPKGTTMGDIYRAAVPFVICDFIAILLLFFIPEIVTYPVQLMFE